MARGRARYQRGRVVAAEGGGWEIHYNVYLTDSATGKPKRHHRSRVVGHAPKMRKAEAETILAAELARVNGGPLARVADGTLSFGEWMRNFYIPMRGANWRPATRRSNDGYLKKQIYPRIEHGIAFHPAFQVLRRSFSTHGKKEAHPTEMQAQLGHSDIRTTLDIYTQIADPEVARMVNQVTNRILGLGEEVEPGPVQ